MKGLPDYTRAVLLKGIDGEGNYRTVLLDSEGKIFGVFYGKDYSLGVAREVRVDSEGRIVGLMMGRYNDTYIPFKVDSEGRGIMFPVDAKDVWGNVIEVGNAELANRLGCPKVYDKRGEVWEIDSFEEGFSRVTVSRGTTSSKVSLVKYPVRHGSLSARVDVASGDYVTFTKCYPLTPIPKIGLEVIFSSPSTYPRCEISLTVRKGIDQYRYGVYVNPSPVPAEVYYYSPTGTWVRFGYVTWYEVGIDLFRNLKLVVNPNTGKYERFLYSTWEIDMTTLSPYATSEASDYLVKAEVTLRSTAAATYTGYLDSIILTINEP